jgi:hypothetical protein
MLPRVPAAAKLRVTAVEELELPTLIDPKFALGCEPLRSCAELRNLQIPEISDEPDDVTEQFAEELEPEPESSAGVALVPADDIWVLTVDRLASPARGLLRAPEPLPCIGPVAST